MSINYKSLKPFTVSVFFIAFFLLFFISPNTFAKVPMKGKCGEHVSWSISGDTLTLKGEGRMWDYDFSRKAENYPLWVLPRDGNGSYPMIRHIIIEDGITHIGAYAFAECSNCATVSIPATVNDIAAGAFVRCYSIKKMDIPRGVKKIDDLAFASCTKLESISLPNSLTSVGLGTFSRCFSLKVVDFPDSVKEIGQSAFEKCKKLSEVTLPSGLKELSGSLFEKCYSLRTVKIPSSVVKIGYGVFQKCIRLRKIVIPSNVTSLSNDVFCDCKRLDVLSIRTRKLSGENLARQAFYGINPHIRVRVPESKLQKYKKLFHKCCLPKEAVWEIK